VFSGIDRIQAGSADKILVLIRAISAQVCGIIIAFTLNWQMTLMMCLIIPFVILTIAGAERVSNLVSRAFYYPHDFQSTKKALKSEMKAYGAAVS
jgi:ABC-type multidrug transport system fused ATPase/permease subunit